MSTWTMEEVNALDERHGGGNTLCRARWYANMSPEQEQELTPKPGDSLDVHKSFIHQVYEQERFYDPKGKACVNAVSMETTNNHAPSLGRSSRKSPPTKTDDVDLLDLDVATTTQSQSNPAPTWDPFAAAPPSQPLNLEKSTSAPTTSSSAFDFLQSAPNPNANHASSFSFLSQPCTAPATSAPPLTSTATAAVPPPPNSMVGDPFQHLHAPMIQRSVSAPSPQAPSMMMTMMPPPPPQSQPQPQPMMMMMKPMTKPANDDPFAHLS